MSSTTFQRLSERTKNSKAFFYSFCAVLGSIPVTLGYFTMKLTNSNNADLEARLRRSGDPNLTVITFSYSFPYYHPIFFNNPMILLLPFLIYNCDCFVIKLTMPELKFISWFLLYQSSISLNLWLQTQNLCFESEYKKP